MTYQLKVAVLLKNSHVPQWQYQMLQRIQQLPQVEIRLLLAVKDKQRSKIITPLSAALRLLKVLDQLGFHATSNPLKNCAIKDLAADALRVDLSEPAAEATYRGQAIDLLIDLADCMALPNFIYHHTRFGSWRIFIDSPQDACSEWSGISGHCSGDGQLFSGIVEKTGSGTNAAGESIRTAAQNSTIQSAGLSGHCIFLTSSRTSPVFLHHSLEVCLWKMSALLPRLVQQLSTSPEPHQWLENKRQRYNPRVAELALESEATATTETKGVLFRRFLRTSLLKRWSVLKTKLLLAERWEPQWVLLYGDRVKLDALKVLQPPADKFWADPQLINYQQRWFVFFEEWVDQQNKGRIACIEWYGDGDFSPVVPVLEENFHLSYPHVFYFAGTYYMIPESAENRTITLYRCTRFPDRWEFVHNLMEDVEAFDATLQEYQGRWWLFVNMRDHECCASDDLLYLYSADSPLSKNWVSHPDNPIVTEVDRARPAGKLIQRGAKFYRLSQNCAGSYGRGLNLNEVITWNSKHYQERLLRQYIPDGKAGLYGMHTFSRHGSRILSDGIVRNSYWKRKKCAAANNKK